jgi:hypothetical protein
MQEEPDDLEEQDAPVRPPSGRRARIMGGILGALAGGVVGLAISHALNDWWRVGVCGFCMGLGVQLGLLGAYLTQGRREEPPAE